MKETTKIKKYFAAANGYGGFRSYFPEIFKADDYNRIFVLKGGPGTGKSSFMRRLGADFLTLGCDIEEIYCSSDPASLDGIIIKNGTKCIAAIDGTAPHETDATVPGACDEIINLGEAWRTDWLTSERERILNINREKKNAYKSAYSSLSIAGKSKEVIRDFKSLSYDDKNAKNAIKSLAEIFNKAEKGDCTTRLTNAFCKNGAVTLDTFKSISENIFYISGDDYPCKRFLNEVRTELLNLQKEFICSPSALEENYVQSIFIPSIETCFVIGEGENRIDTSLFFSEDSLSRERIKCAENCHAIAINDAIRWFGIASELHFTLEEIYSRAMNFDIIDTLYERKLAQIKSILL